MFYLCTRFREELQEGKGVNKPKREFLKKVSKKFRKDFAEQKSGIIFADAFPQKFWGFLEAKKVL